MRIRADGNCLVLELDALNCAVELAKSPQSSYLTLPAPQPGQAARHLVVKSFDGRRRETSDQFAALSLLSETEAELRLLSGRPHRLNSRERPAQYLFSPDLNDIATRYFMAHGAPASTGLDIEPGLLMDIKGPAEPVEWAAARRLPFGVFFQVHARDCLYLANAGVGPHASVRPEAFSCVLAGQKDKTVLHLHTSTEFTRASFKGPRIWHSPDAGYAEVLLVNEQTLPAEVAWEASMRFERVSLQLPARAAA